MALNSDPYAVLGVPRDATEADISQARRRLSREYHPDANRDPGAAARFVEIQQAFELLSDPVARAAHDRARGTEAAPGIFVKPAAVNFGVLTSGSPAVDAEVTVAWTGAPPGRIKSDPGGDWWTTLRAEMPDVSRVVFFLRAQAVAGAANGLKFERFKVTLDDATVAVKLRAEIRGVPLAPTPPTFKTADRVPSVPRPAPRPARPTNGARLGPSLLGLAGTLITFILIAANSCGGGGGSVASSPPVHPINIPQARAAGINVQPVFTPSGPAAAAAVELDTGLGAPVQRGTEIILPGIPDTGNSPPCVAVTVADTSSYGAAGDTFLESPVGTAAVGKERGAAYPAVLPGTYALELDCAPPISETGALPLGTVTVPNLGVVNGGGGFDNAMVIFASQTSGAVTTVTYGAIGAGYDSLIPSNDDACIDADVTTGPDNYWQPVRVLVSQQITGSDEWLSLGTLVFRGTSANSPQGSFFYNCATDTKLGPLGILVPPE